MSTVTTTDAHAGSQPLHDRAEITDLVHRLGAYLDDGRFDEVREILVEDATVRTPGGQAEGREAVLAQAQRNHPDGQRFQHLISNVLVDLDGDRAAVRANLVVHIAMADDDAPRDIPALPLRCAIGEVYSFELVRTRDGWRFSRVQADPRWISGTRPPAPPAPA